MPAQKHSVLCKSRAHARGLNTRRTHTLPPWALLEAEATPAYTTHSRCCQPNKRPLVSGDAGVAVADDVGAATGNCCLHPHAAAVPHQGYSAAGPRGLHTAAAVADVARRLHAAAAAAEIPHQQ